jgi:cell wall-associated NlpC family hydrolase
MVFRPVGQVSAPWFAVRALVCSLLISSSILFVAEPVHAAPPQNPSNSQLRAAQREKNTMAATVGRLSALVAQSETRLHQLSARRELAEQKFALAVSKLNEARQQAAKAKAAVIQAENAIDKARASLQGFLRSSYMSHAVAPTAGALLTASDPNALLQGGDYIRYVSEGRVRAINALDHAMIQKSNAEASAKSLVQLQQRLKIAADLAWKAAVEAVREHRAQQAHLRTQQAAYKGQLLRAQTKLATLNGQRASFLAYNRYLAELAALKVARESAARSRAERDGAALAAQARSNQESGPVPDPGSMGGWSAGVGQDAANWALQQLGTPYSFAGGGADGPSMGTCGTGDSGNNDCHVKGFDCSSLTLFAWAHEGLSLTHYAATQYDEAGAYHPDSGSFMPGDLLFWSSDGTVAGIHHVAMYIGGGNVIQAPESGDVVKVTPWDQVTSGYYGATRPLS